MSVADSLGNALNNLLGTKGDDPILSAHVNRAVPRSDEIIPLHENLVVARNAIEKRASMVEVADSDLERILDKIKSLEGDVQSLLSGNHGGQVIEVPGSKPEDSSTSPDDEVGDTPPHDTDDPTEADARKKVTGNDDSVTRAPGAFQGAELFNAKEKLRTEVFTSFVESTKTTTQTRTNTIIAIPSSGSKQAAAASDPEAKVGGLNAAQFTGEDKVLSAASDTASVTEEPTLIPANSHGPTAPKSFPGHKVSKLPLSTSLPGGVKAKFSNTTSSASGFRTVPLP